MRLNVETNRRSGQPVSSIYEGFIAYDPGEIANDLNFVCIFDFYR